MNAKAPLSGASFGLVSFVTVNVILRSGLPEHLVYELGVALGKRVIARSGSTTGHLRRTAGIPAAEP